MQLVPPGGGANSRRCSTHPCDPVHADEGEHEDAEEDDGADEADVVGAVVEDGVAEGAQDVLDGLAEADYVHGHRYGVGQGEHESDGAAELRSQRPRDHVVYTSCNINSVIHHGR